MVLVISAAKAGMTEGATMGWKSSLERFAEQLAWRAPSCAFAASRRKLPPRRLTLGSAY